MPGLFPFSHQTTKPQSQQHLAPSRSAGSPGGVACLAPSKQLQAPGLPRLEPSQEVALQFARLALARRQRRTYQKPLACRHALRPARSRQGNGFAASLVTTERRKHAASLLHARQYDPFQEAGPGWGKSPQNTINLA
jgi:hypothetical protein